MSADDEFMEQNHPIIFTATQLLEASPPHSPDRALRSPLKALSVIDTPINNAENHMITPQHTIKSKTEDHRLHLLESELQQKNQLILTLQTEYNEYKTSMENQLQKLKDEYEQNIHTLQQQLDNVQAHHAKLQDDHESLQAQHHACISQQDILHQTIISLQTEHRATTATLTEIQSANATLSSTIDILNQKESMHKAEVSSILRENQRLTQDNKFLSAQLHQMTELLHKLAPMPQSSSSSSSLKPSVVASISNDNTGSDNKHHQRMGSGVVATVATHGVVANNNDDNDDVAMNNSSKQENNNGIDNSTHIPINKTPPPSSPLKDTAIDTAESLESSLLSLNQERNQLESELGKYPSYHNGKTVADRRRKMELESRLTEVTKDIGIVKRKLKKLGVL